MNHNPEETQDPNRMPDVAFEAPSENGKSTDAVVSSVNSAQKKKTFNSVSRKTAEAAKKGKTSTSHTGKAKQIDYKFGKPPKGIFVKVHPSPAYRTLNLPVYENEVEGKIHYITPELYESGELPERFQSVCKLMDVYTAGLADATFILWYVFVSSSPWRKAALKVVEVATHGYIVVSSMKARQSYAVEHAEIAIPEPKWNELPSFEDMLLDAFDSVISVADDKVVTDFMSGGASVHDEEDGDE